MKATLIFSEIDARVYSWDTINSYYDLIGDDHVEPDLGGITIDLYEGSTTIDGWFVTDNEGKRSLKIMSAGESTFNIPWEGTDAQIEFIITIAKNIAIIE